MKAFTIILTTVVLVTHVSGYLIKIPTKSAAAVPVTDHTQWVYLQKLMLPLFENVCETSKNLNICTLAQEFNLESTDYMKPEAAKSLENLISSGLLPKGDIFSEYKPNHLNELKTIYEVLYNAKDFNTFYKAAAWARQNVNCALYVDALYMAIQNRKDTEILSIPAPYELLPNYFIDKHVIVQAAKFFEKDYSNFVVPNETVHSEGNSYIIDANYTALFYDNDDDSKLAYFREDIGLNSYYYLRKLRMAPWFNDNESERFGENMFQMIKQFMARYNLERYANELPVIDGINWDTPVYVPYDPMLIHSNGVEFGHRTSTIELSENENVQQMRTIENNISAVVDHLHQRGYNKTHILNHLMEILVTGDRSYETLSRQLLGKNIPNNGETSVLDHYMTSLRDPMFWKINAKILNMIDEALKVLPSYTKNELFFPGVEIVNIDVKKIITTFDYFTFDVTDALKTEETGFRIKIGQPRLNHKQFTIKVNISSLVSQKGIMKVYLGPKLMPGELATKKNLFMLLDLCQVNLKVGSNIITRTPENMNHFSEDFMLLNTIRKNVEYAGFGLDSLPLKTIQSQVGFPSRLILPKGTLQGLPLQMFVFIAPYVTTSIDESYSINNSKYNNAILSPGYPLDLNIEDWQLFELPNVMIKYITVRQKGESKVENYGGPGVTKSWYTTNTYDSSERPNYNSKNQQYGSKKGYSPKKYEYNTNLSDFKSEEENIKDDYNTMYRMENEPTLHMTYRQNSYPSKRKPFDYNAKKGQYGIKDYSVKRNFTKYHTITNNENNIVASTIVNEILSKPDKSVIDIPINNYVATKMSEQENDINTIKEKDTQISLDAQEDSIEIQPLPEPAMLKKDSEGEKFNYKPKKIERNHKIKQKKIELDKLIKDAKMIQKIKNHYRPLNPDDKDIRIHDEENNNLEDNTARVDFKDPNLNEEIENIKVYNSDESIEQTFFGKKYILLNNRITKDPTAIVQKDKIAPDVEDDEKSVGKEIINEGIKDVQKQTDLLKE